MGSRCRSWKGLGRCWCTAGCSRWTCITCRRSSGLVEALDPAAILAELGLRDALSFAPVRGGWDTAIWRVERPSGPAALRLFRAEQKASFAREVAAMTVARSHGLPVPEVLAQGVWQERPVVLLSWCAGKTLAAALQARPWTAWTLGRAFGEM